MSKLHFLWTKIYFNIEMYLWSGDTCHVGTLFEVSPHHRFYCIFSYHNKYHIWNSHVIWIYTRPRATALAHLYHSIALYHISFIVAYLGCRCFCNRGVAVSVICVSPFWRVAVLTSYRTNYLILIRLKFINKITTDIIWLRCWVSCTISLPKCKIIVKLRAGNIWVNQGHASQVWQAFTSENKFKQLSIWSTCSDRTSGISSESCMHVYNSRTRYIGERSYFYLPPCQRPAMGDIATPPRPSVCLSVRHV